MVVAVSKPEASTLLLWLSEALNLGLDEMVATFNAYVTITTGIQLTYKLPVGSVSMLLALSAADGCLVLDIEHAQAIGLNWFGVLREKAGEIILGALNPYQHLVKSWKHTDGNIRLQLPSGAVTAASCDGGVLSLTFEL